MSKQEIEVLKGLESIRKTDWAAGSRKTEKIEYLCANIETAELSFKKVYYNSALYHSFSEVLINACDQFINTNEVWKDLDEGEITNKIEIYFEDDGKIVIKNNGRGIPIEKKKVGEEEIYIPQLVYWHLFTSANYDKNPASITGGSNGLGAKIANAFSKEFKVETIYRGQRYIQEGRDHGMIIKEPVIKNSKSKPYTCIAFLPDYEELGIDISKRWTAIAELFYARSILAKLYLDLSAHGCTVSFNGKNIKTTSADLVKHLFAGVGKNMIEVVKIIPDCKKPDNKVKGTTAIADRPDYYASEITIVCDSTDSGPKVKQLSMINAVYVSNGGTHINEFRKQLSSFVKKQIADELDKIGIKIPQMFLNNSIFIFANMRIPDVNWNGQQNKQESAIADKICKCYKLEPSEKFIKAVSKFIKETVSANVKQKSAKKEKNKLPLDKYMHADAADSIKHRKYSSLLLAEGDSAIAMIVDGYKGVDLSEYPAIRKDKKKFPSQYFGILSVGGIIVNGRKQTKKGSPQKDEGAAETSESEEQKRVKDPLLLKKILLKNKFFNEFLAVTGLDTKETYEVADILKKLKYGRIIMCVDEDHDGRGKIASLILNIFHLFWPELIEYGYIYRLLTPIVRVFFGDPTKRSTKFIDFYAETEFEEYNRTSNKDYQSQYYKGLSGHSGNKAAAIFQRLKIDFDNSGHVEGSNLVKFAITKHTGKLFEIYLGGSPALRKKELSKPFKMPSAEWFAELLEGGVLKCSDQLRYFEHEHAKHDLLQKLPHVFDGMNEVRRKVFYTVLKSKSSSFTKVAQLSSIVANKQDYHHGENNINNVIIGMASIYPCGGCQLPIFIPDGQFGGRFNGLKSAGQPRYIFVKNNTKLIKLLYTNGGDLPQLVFRKDEGTMREPEYFVPIIPTVLAEFHEKPSHGWNVTSYARDVFSIIENCRICIENAGVYADKLNQMPLFMQDFAGEYIQDGGDEWTIGHYYYDDAANALYIDELPVRETIMSRIKKLEKKQELEKGKIIDTEPILLEFKLKDRGVFEEIKTKASAKADKAEIDCDPILHYLGLVKKMSTNLNYYGENHSVVELKTYAEVFSYWFPKRKEIYRRRIERNLILNKLKLLVLEEKRRYVKTFFDKDAGFGKDFRKLTKKEWEAALEQNKFRRLNEAGLKSKDIDFIPNEELNSFITEGGSFAYLDLRDSKKYEEGQKKMKEKAAELKEQIEIDEKEMSAAFPGKQMWLDELDELEEFLKENMRDCWGMKE